MIRMMDNPVAAMMVFVGLIVLVAVIFIAVRFFGAREHRSIGSAAAAPRTAAGEVGAPPAAPSIGTADH